MLQHSLPLQHDSFFGGVAAVAVPIKARTLRINNRFFINSYLILMLNSGDASSSRAERSLKRKRKRDAAAELADVEFARKRDRY